MGGPEHSETGAVHGPILRSTRYQTDDRRRGCVRPAYRSHERRAGVGEEVGTAVASQASAGASPIVETLFAPQSTFRNQHGPAACRHENLSSSGTSSRRE